MPVLAGAALMAGSSGGSNHTATTVVAIIIAILGVGTVALLVSQSAQTAGVTKAGGTSLANLICVALSPVTGGSCGGLLTSVSSGVNFGCTTVGGKTYCP